MNAKDFSQALGEINQQYVTEATTYTPKAKSLWRSIIAAAACLCILVGLLFPNLGPSGADPTGLHYGTQAYYGYGTPLKGLILTGDTTSVEVLNQRITMDLTGSPLDYEEIFHNSATMEYTFHNPTAEAITITLTLPCGQAPNYTSDFHYQTGTYLLDASQSLYSVSADGSPSNFRLRLTGSNIAPKEDGTWKNGIFSDTTPVTKLTYQVTELEQAEESYANFHWISRDDCALIVEEETLFLERKTGDTCLVTTSVTAGQTVTFYLAGELPEELPEWEFYSMPNETNQISGVAELVSSETISFLDFAQKYYDEALHVTPSDWACALAAEQEAFAFDHNIMNCGGMMEYRDVVYRWLEYKLTLDPGETVVNTVTMPVFPDVMLSNGGQWLNLEWDILSLRIPLPQSGPEIIVNTPFPMTESSQVFTETETGYALNMTGIYPVSLSFRLEQHPVSEPNAAATFYWNPWLVLPAAVVLLLLFLIPKKQ